MKSSVVIKTSGGETEYCNETGASKAEFVEPVVADGIWSEDSMIVVNVILNTQYLDDSGFDSQVNVFDGDWEGLSGIEGQDIDK